MSYIGTSRASAWRPRKYHFVLENPETVAPNSDAGILGPRDDVATDATDLPITFPGDPNVPDETCNFADQRDEARPFSPISTVLAHTDGVALSPTIAQGVQFNSLAHRFDPIFERCKLFLVRTGLCVGKHHSWLI